MKQISYILKALISGLLFMITTISFAGMPVWTFTPLTVTTLSVPANGTALVQYQVTNQSSKVHTLIMKSIPGVTQLTTGLGVCRSPFVLIGKASCVLSLQIDGRQLTSPINDGPIVCENGSSLQCYRPSAANILHITQIPGIANGTIAVSGSPLMLTTNGPSAVLTINNTSLDVTATNITSDFTGTALDGNVTETGNTCANVPPQASCTLTYTPGGTVVPQTSFSIRGSNTNVVTAAIQIDAGITISSVNPPSGTASGGTGVTLTGVGFTGATAVTFGGQAATSVNVVNSTTVTAVTPASAAGVVDVEITTPTGSATLINGYTYLISAVGQAAFGGTIACLNGGLNNLIAATADNSVGIEWGGVGIVTNATSIADGASNTATIVATLGGAPTYAAALCSTYEVDSQGNAPCQAGNTCYNDWFLPAGNNPAASGQLNCLYTNQIAIGGFIGGLYWSSTENSNNFAWNQDFSNGLESTAIKSDVYSVRCVRSFTP